MRSPSREECDLELEFAQQLQRILQLGCYCYLRPASLTAGRCDGKVALRLQTQYLSSMIVGFHGWCFECMLRCKRRFWIVAWATHRKHRS
jgi:hypothetical protein